MLIKLVGELRGDIVHFNMFMGPRDGGAAHCGTMSMGVVEYATFCRVLAQSADGNRLVVQELLGGGEA